MQCKRNSLWIIPLLILIASQSFAASKPTKSDWDWYQAQGQKKASWDSLVQSGFEAFDSDNWNTAITFLMRAKGKGCKDGLVLIKIALYHEAKGEKEKALDWLKKAEDPLNRDYSTHPMTLDLPDHFGRLYYLLDKYDDALSYLEAAIEKRGDGFMRLFLAGQIWSTKENWAKAADYFERCLKQPAPPGTPVQPLKQAWLELMKADFQLQQFDKTLDIANKILEFEPGNPSALSYKQKVQEMQYKQKEREVIERITQ